MTSSSHNKFDESTTMQLTTSFLSCLDSVSAVSLYCDLLHKSIRLERRHDVAIFHFKQQCALNTPEVDAVKLAVCNAHQHGTTLSLRFAALDAVTGRGREATDWPCRTDIIAGPQVVLQPIQLLSPQAGG